MVDVAAELFTSHGSGFTSSQLASAAGVSEGTVFRYFPDMSSLMRAARRQAIGLDRLLPELRLAGEHKDLRSRLLAAANALTERIVETARLVEASGETTGRPPHREIEEVLDALTPLFVGADGGWFTARQQAAMFLGLLVSGTIFSSVPPLSTNESPCPEQPAGDCGSGSSVEVQQIVDLFLNGLLSMDRTPSLD